MRDLTIDILLPGTARLGLDIEQLYYLLCYLYKKVVHRNAAGLGVRDTVTTEATPVTLASSILLGEWRNVQYILVFQLYTRLDGLKAGYIREAVKYMCDCQLVPHLQNETLWATLLNLLYLRAARTPRGPNQREFNYTDWCGVTKISIAALA